jgi:hypothetical protein
VAVVSARLPGWLLFAAFLGFLSLRVLGLGTLPAAALTLLLGAAAAVLLLHVLPALPALRNRRTRRGRGADDDDPDGDDWRTLR